MSIVTCSLRASRFAIGAIVLSAALLTGCGLDDKSSASQPVSRVGLMHVGTDHIPPSKGSLEARLKELGWTQGQNIKLIWRNLEPGQAAGQARAFVRQRVDVIVAFEDQSIYAAQDATAGMKDPVPIVFLHPSDPVRDGLVKSLSHPGGNLTGVFGPRDVVATQLERYELLVPRLHRVLTLVDPNDPATARLLPQYRTAAEHLPRPLELDIRQASTAKDLRRIFRSLRPGEVDGAFLLSPRLRRQLLVTDDPARRSERTCRFRRTARTGFRRAHSSRTGPTSARSDEPARATSTAFSGARRRPTYPSRRSRLSSSRST